MPENAADGTSHPLSADSAVESSGGFDFYGGPTVAGHLGSGSLRFGFGGWLGAQRVTAETGIGFVSCAEHLCCRASDDQLHVVGSLPIALSVQRLSLSDHGLGQFAMGWGIGMRYIGFHTSLPGLAHGEPRVIHSLLIVASWAVGDNLPMGFDSHGRAATWEFERPFGLRTGAAGESREIGFTLGFGLRGAGPI